LRYFLQKCAPFNKYQFVIAANALRVYISYTDEKHPDFIFTLKDYEGKPVHYWRIYL